MADPADIRVLIPRVRRAVEGVGQPQVLSDDQVKDLVADAIANLILFTGGVFDKQLLVTSTDDTTGAPAEYATDKPLTLAEGSVVAYEAALAHCFFLLRDLKTQETIRDEGGEWSYALSPNLLRDHIKYLQDQRDRALAETGSAQTAVAWVEHVHHRDAHVMHFLGAYC